MKSKFWVTTVALLATFLFPVVVHGQISQADQADYEATLEAAEARLEECSSTHAELHANGEGYRLGSGENAYRRTLNGEELGMLDTMRAVCYVHELHIRNLKEEYRRRQRNQR
ncbi:MAG: hypothetical protein ACR2PR_06100 [Pseudohongiellaceae bacterium]